VELFLPCPASVGLGRRADSLWGRGYSCQVQAWSRSLLRHPNAQIDEGVAKKWFYLRNDTSTLLPMFTDSHPIPLPPWGDGVARKDLSKLQLVHEALSHFQQVGLMGAHVIPRSEIAETKPPYVCP
jgi:hypothetical protein